jgi:eukaryotic-like serine/threonine-protein kinase
MDPLALSPELYRRINALVDAALELPADRRPIFLDKNCAEDLELRTQVEHLLAAHESDSDLLEASALELIAKDLATLPIGEDLTGREIHHYTVLSRLGAGGMGAVWLARDTHLPREVAIKLLSPRFAGDPYHAKRFQREARAASTLNHPNIVTIYEIGTTEGVDFIAQEFVLGHTLRERLSQGPMPLLLALDIAEQVATALAAAHGAGIVHRDIKPENVMIRPDGLVKVLDWGLARLTERMTQALDEPPANDSAIRPGFVLGTVRYMSPEHARGLTVDSRSDIFSLGVILYEMVAGVAPFRGTTPNDVLSGILLDQPEPLSSHLAGAPPELERIVRLCLQKQREARYSDAAELRKDLSRLRRRMEPLSLSSQLPALSSNLQPPGRARGALWATLAVVFAALIGSGILITINPRRNDSFFNSMKISRLTTRGEVADAAISPGGNSVAYVLQEDRGQSLWIKQLATGSEIMTRAPETGQHTGLTFSPDGNYLYYRRQIGNGTFALYRLSMQERREPVELANNVSAIALAPGGRRFAFFRIDPSQRQSSLMLANADGTGVRTIRTRRLPEYFGRYSLAWSPDGRWIACFAGNGRSPGGQAFHLIEVSVANGGEKTISARSWRWGGSIVWPANKNRLLFDATDQIDGEYQIWSASLENGAVSRLTNDLNDYRRLSLTSDAKTMLAVETQTASDVWVASNGDSNRANQLTFGNVHSLESMAWTPDSRIVYSARSGDSHNLWIMDDFGRDLKQLTDGPYNKVEVAVTRDGKYVVYQGEGKIWRIGLDGAHPLQLTHGAQDVHPEPTPDSRSVVYASFTNWSPGIAGKPTLWKVPIEGGKPVQLSSIAASIPKVSVDGKLIAFEYFPGADPQLSPHQVAVMNSQGGPPTKIFDRLPTLNSDVFWAPDGKSLEFVVLSKRVGNLWRQPLNGVAPLPVTHFNTGRMFTLAWSHDGRQLAMARGKTSHEVILIQDFE